MKKILLMIAGVLLFLQLAAQQQPVVKDRQYYLDKSKSQRITGWVLAGAGSAMIIGGYIGFQENFDLFGPGGENEAWIMLLGVPVALSSIPFFISASKNKGRAEMMAGPGV
ncbi:MAG TPA: hypothetical protein PKE63_09280 [Lacibacter sp.]|nr:hypothetical protein [Lacibacter sp.]HMO90392.1 hypothetical protein [Lacibacter sp.]HMP87456.1 hypothetical protein [Lacibacter sp.]